jgi:hypothetical protein
MFEAVQRLLETRNQLEHQIGEREIAGQLQSRPLEVTLGVT